MIDIPFLEKVTAPGPRNLVHVKITGGPRFFGLAPDEFVNFASSDTHTVNGIGVKEEKH